MPLSDLFKKSPKKESDRNNPLGTPEIQKKRYDAAMEFVKIFQEKIPLLRGKPHAGTVLAIAARLAGSSLYRSLNSQKDIAPGVVVLSDEVNEAWPRLMNIFAFYCKQNGIDVMSKPMITKFPEQIKPLMEAEQVLAEYQDQYHEIMKKHGLDYLDGARAGMIVCSVMFQYHCMKVKDIDPYIATGIVAMGIVEGAKTSPVPLRSEGSKPAATPMPVNNAQNDQLTPIVTSIANNSLDGSGTRLVLGEGMNSMQEAMTKGGKYILVHPEVINKLKQNNIDPYLIYEAALRIEIESKIPQIEFVGANVDTLLREWGTKPQAQAPFHVRQLLWLNDNAASFGYQRSENSWVLK